MGAGPCSPPSVHPQGQPLPPAGWGFPCRRICRCMFTHPVNKGRGLPPRPVLPSRFNECRRPPGIKLCQVQPRGRCRNSSGGYRELNPQLFSLPLAADTQHRSGRGAATSPHEPCAADVPSAAPTVDAPGMVSPPLLRSPSPQHPAPLFSRATAHGEEGGPSRGRAGPPEQVWLPGQSLTDLPKRRGDTAGSGRWEPWPAAKENGLWVGNTARPASLNRPRYHASPGTGLFCHPG